MIIAQIDEETLFQAKRVIMEGLRKDSLTWWHKRDVPAQGIVAMSLGTGTIREGLIVYLIGGHNREVFPDDAPKFKVYEFVGLVKNTGWQPLVQLGRDVDFVTTIVDDNGIIRYSID